MMIQRHDDSAHTLAMRAYLLLEAGELAQARMTLVQAIDVHGDEPMLHALSGGVEMAAGELKAALKILRRTMRRWPAHPASYVYAAETYFLMRNSGQARRTIARVQDEARKHKHGWLEPWRAHLELLSSLCEELRECAIPDPLISLDET